MRGAVSGGSAIGGLRLRNIPVSEQKPVILIGSVADDDEFDFSGIMLTKS